MNRKILWPVFALAGLTASLAFSQTVWHKYEGNPVLQPVAEWEYYGNINTSIVKVGDEYQLWYTGIGSHLRIGLATSRDGIHWTKYNANPILNIGSPGDFDSEHVYTPIIVYHNNLYLMWYSGHNGMTWQIGLATSEDGVHWTKYTNNPVLKIGNPGEWDDKQVSSPFVMYDGSFFKMWYRGESVTSPGKGSTGYAESLDGIHWDKYPGNPVFGPVPGTWESWSLTIYPVVKRSNIYEGWYAASDGSTSRIGYATSVNGIHWERYPNNPILSPTGDNSWESQSISSPFVLLEQNIYKLWYSGNGPDGWSIGYATSVPMSPTERLVFLPRVYGLPGDTINVTLYADPIGGISGGDFVIRFDPEILTATAVHTTDFTSNFLVAANLDTPGIARISLAGAQGAIGELGGLVTIRMAVNPGLPVDTTFSRPLHLLSAALYDENAIPLPAKTRDGIFVLGSSRGDVNFDGFINAADAILTLRIAAGLLHPTPEQFVAADFDGNGRVESFDASCILRRAVGLDCPIGGMAPVAATLEIAPFTAGAGTDVETQIAIDGIDKLLSGDLSLRYDATALDITEIRPSPEMLGTAFVSNLNSPGRTHFSFAATSGFHANAIAVIRLRAKTQVDERQLRAIEAVFYDSQGQRWSGVMTGVDEPRLPAGFRLEQNYPNPFYRHASGVNALAGLASPSLTNTQIRYSLSRREHVKLIVYDVYGRQVRVLEDAEKAAGEYMQRWEGLDESGKPVASGVYVYRLQAGQNVLTRKMLVLE